MPAEPLSLDDAVDVTRTGDIWIFRGHTPADRVIQSVTNSPVNHVGMAVVLDDLPPLMWHAELGRALPDLWSGTHQRGVQLHDLRAAVNVWARRYGQRAWLRQLEPPVDRALEDAVLRTIARLDGTPFPSTAQMGWRWLRSRVPQRIATMPTTVSRPARRRLRPSAGQVTPALESAYCAEVVALTYEAMGLLRPGHDPSWYDPGRFWSGDNLRLAKGARLGEEIAIIVT